MQQSRLKKLMVFIVEQIEKVVFFGTVDTPFIPWKEYPELYELERHHPVILQEYLKYIQQATVTYMNDLSYAQNRIVESKKWQALFLMVYGKKVYDSEQYFAQTRLLLDKIPGIKTVLFSSFSPGTHLIPHRGPYKGVLRYHLGLIIPDEADKCALKIGETVCHWEAGKSLLFDDTFMHEAWNHSGQTRVVLFLDVERKLRFPFNYLNKFFLFIIQRSPFVNEIFTKATKA